MVKVSSPAKGRPAPDRGFLGGGGGCWVVGVGHS